MCDSSKKACRWRSRKNIEQGEEDSKKMMSKSNCRGPKSGRKRRSVARSRRGRWRSSRRTARSHSKRCDSRNRMQVIDEAESPKQSWHSPFESRQRLKEKGKRVALGKRSLMSASILVCSRILTRPNLDDRCIKHDRDSSPNNTTLSTGKSEDFFPMTHILDSRLLRTRSMMVNSVPFTPDSRLDGLGEYVSPWTRRGAPTFSRRGVENI